MAVPTAAWLQPPEADASQPGAAGAVSATDEAHASPGEPEAGSKEQAPETELADAASRDAAASTEAADAGVAPSEAGDAAAKTDEQQAKPGRKQASAKPPHQHRQPCPRCPPAPDCCGFRMDGGPRFGVSVNGDQWIAGGHLRFPVPCLAGLTVEPVVLVGFGGNWLSWRSSLRLLYLFWIGGEQGLGIYPSVGRSILFRMPNPFSRFSSFCYRTNLDECWGWDSGFELGGGVQYRWIGIDALVGWGELPVVTITATATFTLWASGS